MSVIKTDLPLAPEDMSWSAGEAIKAVKSWASDDDGNIDFSKYKKAFFFVDDDNDGDDHGGEAQGDYKLPFATIVDGDLKAVWKGVSGCMAALNGARGGVDLGDDDDEKAALYKQICVYYKKFDKDPPELAKAMSSKALITKGDRIDFMMNVDNSTIKELGDDTFSATITTSDVDRMGESIDYAGVDTSAYMQNPVVLYGHDYSGLPIGKTLKLARSHVNKAWNATFQLASEIYPFAATVAAMIKAGYLNAVSIGGVVKDFTGDPWSGEDLVITAMEMVEFSIVPVPANPNALITGRSFEKAVGKSTQEVAKEFHDFLEKSVSEKLKGLDTDELVRHIDTLKKLLAILEATATKEAETKSETDVMKVTLRKTANEMARTSEEIIKVTKAKE